MTDSYSPVPSIPNEKSLKTGKIASSSKIAISSASIANTLYTFAPVQLWCLSLREDPYPNIGGSTNIDPGVLGLCGVELWTHGADAFIVGEREAPDGEVAYGYTSAIFDPWNSTSGTGREGVTVYRNAFSNTPYRYFQTEDFLAYSISVIPYQAIREASLPVLPRSQTTPQISFYEDDFIGEAANGSFSDIIDAIKGAWQLSCRCLFYTNQTFSTAQTAWNNYVDFLVGTTNFTVDCRGRKLYQNDTTATVYCFAEARPQASGGGKGCEVKFSGSKGSTTLVLSSGGVQAYGSIPVDCVADDSITISFRAQSASTGTCTYVACGIMEVLTTAPE